MPNVNYRRGRAKEYYEMAKLKKEGWEVLRTAGSHGTFDIIAIKKPAPGFAENPSDSSNFGEIKLIQVKGGKSAEKEARKLSAPIAEYSGTYEVVAEVRT